MMTLQEPTDRALTRPRILVVEDEALVAADLEDRLERIGYEVCGRADTPMKP
jgi:CheY-like chemotaxis protein